MLIILTIKAHFRQREYAATSRFILKSAFARLISIAEKLQQSKNTAEKIK